MAPKVRTTAKAKYANYVRKSDQFARAAADAQARGDWDAAVSNAVHAAIAMADALAVFYAGHRSAAQSHQETLEVLFGLALDRTDLERNSAHLSRLLGVKTAAEYEERLLEGNDAARALKHMDRFRQWAKAKLP